MPGSVRQCLARSARALPAVLDHTIEGYGLTRDRRVLRRHQLELLISAISTAARAAETAASPARATAFVVSSGWRASIRSTNGFSGVSVAST